MLEPARILVQPDGSALVGGVAVARGQGERCLGDDLQVREVAFLRLGRDGERRGLVELSQGELGSCAESLGSVHPLDGGGLLVSGWRALGISEGAERLPFAAKLTAAGELDESLGDDGVLSMIDPSAVVAPVGAGLYVSSGSIYTEEGRRLQSVVVPGEIEDVTPLDGDTVAVAYFRHGVYHAAVFEPRPVAGRLPDEGGVELHPPSERSSADRIRVLAHDDSLYVLVVYGPWAGRGYVGVLARHNADGEPDPSFGDGGRVLVEPRRFPLLAQDVAVTPHGGVVVAGQFEEAGRRVAFVASWTPSGERDLAFGDEGLVRLELGRPGINIFSDSRTAVGVRPDGSVLLAASVAGRAPVIASYTADGRLEASFGRGGVLRLPGV